MDLWIDVPFANKISSNSSRIGFTFNKMNKKQLTWKRANELVTVAAEPLSYINNLTKSPGFLRGIVCSKDGQLYTTSPALWILYPWKLKMEEKPQNWPQTDQRCQLMHPKSCQILMENHMLHGWVPMPPEYPFHILFWCLAQHGLCPPWRRLMQRDGGNNEKGNRKRKKKRRYSRMPFLFRLITIIISSPSS